MPEILSFAEFARRYCERQDNDPENLLRIFQRHRAQYQPIGWMLLECQVFDSSDLGHLRILVYGPNNTYKELVTTPVSFDGLVSTTSVVVAVLPVENLPDEV